MSARLKAALWIQREVIDPEVATADADARAGSTPELRAEAKAELDILSRLTRVVQRIIAQESGA